MQVTKRNGKKEDFSKDKIFNAISLANENTKYKYRLTKAKIHEITDIVAEAYLIGGRTRSVEVIQDMIEETLVDAGAYGVAKAFITYRYKSDVARNFGAAFIDEIIKKLSANDVQNQNANVDEHSFGGRMGEATEVLTKKLALENLVSSLARKNHEENMIYIHDLGHYFVGDHNCLSIPFDPLLARGFNTRQTDVRSAGSTNTAGQLVAVVSQLQSLQQFGGVSATHIDHTMVPYIRLSFLKHFNKFREFVSDFPGIRKRPQIEVDNPRELSIEDYQQFYKSKHNFIDKLVYKYALKETEREAYQAAEGLFHNLNTLQSRSGCQLKNTVAGC